jgi:multidrug efflux system outer membrane protein
VQSTNNQYAVGFDVAWEADLFGRLGDARRAAQREGAGWRRGRAGGASQRQRRGGAQLLELRGLQEQLRVAVASLDTQKAALELVDAL